MSILSGTFITSSLLASSHPLRTMNNADTNVHVQVFVWTCVFFSPACFPASAIAVLYGTSQVVQWSRICLPMQETQDSQV